jgi:hypothetical protein
VHHCVCHRTLQEALRQCQLCVSLLTTNMRRNVNIVRSMRLIVNFVAQSDADACRTWNSFIFDRPIAGEALAREQMVCGVAFVWHGPAPRHAKATASCPEPTTIGSRSRDEQPCHACDLHQLPTNMAEKHLVVQPLSSNEPDLAHADSQARACTKSGNCARQHQNRAHCMLADSALPHDLPYHVAVALEALVASSPRIKRHHFDPGVMKLLWQLSHSFPHDTITAIRVVSCFLLPNVRVDCGICSPLHA